MTDLCDEEEAAVEARKHINFATEVDPSNPEGWQVISYGCFMCCLIVSSFIFSMKRGLLFFCIFCCHSCHFLSFSMFCFDNFFCISSFLLFLVHCSVLSFLWSSSLWPMVRCQRSALVCNDWRMHNYASHLLLLTPSCRHPSMLNDDH